MGTDKRLARIAKILKETARIQAKNKRTIDRLERWVDKVTKGNNGNISTRIRGE